MFRRDLAFVVSSHSCRSLEGPPESLHRRRLKALGDRSLRGDKVKAVKGARDYDKLYRNADFKQALRIDDILFQKEVDRPDNNEGLR